jgi:CO/xanthine dehydrogenase Mo-binding subunit
MSATEYVGARLPRIDGIQHVTAQTKYVNDIYLPGMLWIKVFRSPYHSAKILGIDTSKAEKVPGVVRVLTHLDVPNNIYGDMAVLAADEVRYKGQEIVAVVAVDEDSAAEGVEKVKVRFEPRTPVFDPIKAMEPDSPKVTPAGNLLMFNGKPYRPLRKGDVEKGLAEADVIVEGYYRSQAQEHTPMETQCSVVEPCADGRLTVHSVSQAIFFHLGTLAAILGVPQGRIRTLGGINGGGFGSKNEIHADHITAVAALRTGKPCKWLWTREEELVASTTRAATHMYFTDGVKKDGRIIARKVKSIRDCGAYGGFNAYVQSKHAYMIAGPYNIPNVWVDSYAVFTNKKTTSSMRGFGVYQGSFSSEVQMDRIAEKLGMDPWEIRFINAIHNGDTHATQCVLHNVSLIECMKTVAREAGVQLPAHLLAMSSAPREV